MPRNNEIIEVDIDKLDNDLWDSRSYKNPKTRQKIEERVEELAENIKREGLHTPILIALPKQHNGHYSIVTGRLRTRAHKKLGLKKIKCLFTDETDKNKLKDITFSENNERKNLTLDDQLYRTKDIIEQNGYTLAQAMSYAKSLYNASNTHKPATKVPDKFKKMLEKLPKLGNNKAPSHNYLYAILSTMVNNDKEVVMMFEDYGLNMHKRIMITNTQLRKHPVIQKSLITQTAGMSIEKARIVIAQSIRDIETKALVKTGKDCYTIDYDKREKIDTRIHVVKESVEKYFDILDTVHDLMYSLTGHKIARGESEYEQKHIDFSEPYRIEILKGLSPLQKRALFKDLTTVSDAIDSFLDIIENDSGTKKEEEKSIKNDH